MTMSSTSTTVDLCGCTEENERVHLRAREVIARALAVSFMDTRVPRPENRIASVDPVFFADAWAVFIEPVGSVEPSDLGLGEVSPEDDMYEGIHEALMLDDERREAVLQSVFGLVTCPDCPPYETEYCHTTDPTYRAHHLADLAGFYTAFGLQVADHSDGRVDHIAHHLDFMAFLCAKRSHALETGGAKSERVHIVQEALTHFVSDHLAWWIPTFATAVEHKARAQATSDVNESLGLDLKTFASLARSLRAWATCERILNGVEPSRRIITPQLSVSAHEEGEGCAGCDPCGPTC